jgi:hypothetical protein
MNNQQHPLFEPAAKLQLEKLLTALFPMKMLLLILQMLLIVQLPNQQPQPKDTLKLVHCCSFSIPGHSLQHLLCPCVCIWVAHHVLERLDRRCCWGLPIWNFNINVETLTNVRYLLFIQRLHALARLPLADNSVYRLVVSARTTTFYVACAGCPWQIRTRSWRAIVSAPSRPAAAAAIQVV